ncbi:MAG: hypothetical protein IT376_00175 [Polyangiaceae bacterium]|nr:hypothetical protein [Polyangiaceae bacterium]
MTPVSPAPARRARAAWARARAAALSLAAVALGGPACGPGPDAHAPRVEVAGTREAQRAFRELRARWARERDDRSGMQPALRAFLSAHPEDGRARLARVMLAWSLVDQGGSGLVEARAIVREVGAGRPGRERDLARVAEAAIARRRGDADGAVELLLPLRGRLFDPDELALHAEELAEAALAARRYQTAVLALRDWLALAPLEERAAVRAATGALAGRIPLAAAERALADLDAEARQDPGRRDAATTAREWLREALRERLVDAALAGSDGELARRLLDQAPAAFRRSERGARLAALAAGGGRQARVEGRVVGVVVATRDALTRARSSAIVSGALHALGLPRGAGRGVDLVTVEDAGGPGDGERAVAAAASEGALIVIAGVDDATSAAAGRRAAVAGVPLVLLASPAGDALASPFVFEAGAAPGEERRALGAALGEGRTVVGGPGADVDCERARPVGGGTRFPVGAWRAARVPAVLLLGSAGCARELLREAEQARLQATLGFGLEAAVAAAGAAPASRLAVLTSGSYPEGGEGGAPPAAHAAWVARAGSPPGWWEALGRDAAALARAAIVSFPEERAEDALRVSALHERARRALASAEAPLWTTDARGFGGAQRLPRVLRVVERGGEPRRRR